MFVDSLFCKDILLIIIIFRRSPGSPPWEFLPKVVFLNTVFLNTVFLNTVFLNTVFVSTVFLRMTTLITSRMISISYRHLCTMLSATHSRPNIIPIWQLYNFLVPTPIITILGSTLGGTQVIALFLGDVISKDLGKSQKKIWRGSLEGVPRKGS